ncbi:hypothetical protein ACFLIM_48220 [Nonomuraea sp. M3C6]|uniref:Phage shock protein B n=1 Tax=Nonomuraea marmarensis TaxID=3351344 RepID=A0ABW7AU55_9ACTN
MTAYLQAAATVAALALMYVVCIRPMMRKGGSCHTTAGRPAGLDEQIRGLRKELTLLRHEADLRRSASRPDGGA